MLIALLVSHFWRPDPRFSEHVMFAQSRNLLRLLFVSWVMERSLVMEKITHGHIERRCDTLHRLMTIVL